MKIDLLIVDIDDTFVYHRTVAAANKVFLRNAYHGVKDDLYTTKKSVVFMLLNFYKFRFRNIGKVIRLGFLGFYLLKIIE